VKPESSRRRVRIADVVAGASERPDQILRRSCFRMDHQDDQFWFPVQRDQLRDEREFRALGVALHDRRPPAGEDGLQSLQLDPHRLSRRGVYKRSTRPRALIIGHQPAAAVGPGEPGANDLYL
jgi:hypothetical protein